MKTVYLKYAAGVLLFGALFYLTLVGKMASSDFETLVIGALGGLGGHVLTKGAQNAQ